VDKFLTFTCDDVDMIYPSIHNKWAYVCFRDRNCGQVWHRLCRLSLAVRDIFLASGLRQLLVYLWYEEKCSLTSKRLRSKVQ